MDGNGLLYRCCVRETEREYFERQNEQRQQQIKRNMRKLPNGIEFEILALFRLLSFYWGDERHSAGGSRRKKKQIPHMYIGRGKKREIQIIWAQKRRSECCSLAAIQPNIAAMARYFVYKVCAGHPFSVWAANGKSSIWYCGRCSGGTDSPVLVCVPCYHRIIQHCLLESRNVCGPFLAASNRCADSVCFPSLSGAHTSAAKQTHSSGAFVYPKIACKRPYRWAHSSKKFPLHFPENNIRTYVNQATGVNVCCRRR